MIINEVINANMATSSPFNLKQWLELRVDVIFLCAKIINNKISLVIGRILVG
jgi:hypothetical protein